MVNMVTDMDLGQAKPANPILSESDPNPGKCEFCIELGLHFGLRPNLFYWPAGPMHPVILVSPPRGQDLTPSTVGWRRGMGGPSRGAQGQK